MATPYILHHHDPSPFAEKIRRAFGIKGLEWNSVQVPMVMPKPLLTELTGGYRGTPVLQIGADIYCDTRRIIAEIEARDPAAPLLGAGPLMNYAMQHWSDDAYWVPGSALSLHENAQYIPQAVTEDRKEYFGNLDFGQFETDAPHFRSQIQAHAGLIEAQLSDGRAFLCGDKPEWVDLGAWHNIWMADGNIPSATDLYAGMEHMAAWKTRMEAFGCGDRTDIPGEDALAIAKASAPDPISADNSQDPSGIAAGSAVCVIPVGHEETATSGTLIAATPQNVTILRRTDDSGDLHIHYPRIGYRLERSTAAGQ